MRVPSILYTKRLRVRSLYYLRQCKKLNEDNATTETSVWRGGVVFGRGSAPRSFHKRDV